MSSSRSIVLRFFVPVVAFWLSAVARATLVPGFLPVAGAGTGTPYDPAALTADPALANYATYDLVVTVGSGERWSFASIVTSTNSSGIPASTIPGNFYAPPTHAGHVDNDFPQQSVYAAAADRNFKYDTWLSVILSAPDPDGNYWGVFDPNQTIIGRADYPITAPGPVVFPRNAGNPHPPSAADLARNKIDVTWGDQGAIIRTYPNPGTYTLARLTFDSGASGNWIVGHLGGTQHNFTDEQFAFQLPQLPEPSLLALPMGLLLAARRRKSR